MKRIRTVEVREVNDCKEVNELLKNPSWLLRDIATMNGKITYILERSESFDSPY